jgi:hypothetical protein
MDSSHLRRFYYSYGRMAAYMVRMFAGPPQTTSSGSGLDVGQLTGASILVNVYHEGAQTNPVNGVFVLPNAINLSKSDLNYIDSRGVTAWAIPRGGYDLPWTTVKITVTARRRVRIIGMRAVILSASASPTGTLLEPAEQGAVDNTAVDIGLASANPVAVVTNKDDFPTKEDYSEVRYSPASPQVTGLRHGSFK